MKKIFKILLGATVVFVISFVFLILFERYLLFYISWQNSVNYGELLDEFTFTIFICSIIIFCCLLFSRFQQKKRVPFVFFYIVFFAISSPLSRIYMHRNLELPEFAAFQGDYIKCERNSIIGLLDKWGNTAVPCEYQFIYRFFDNEIGRERFASYSKEEDKETSYIYIYDSGKRIRVDNLPFRIESNVELYIQDNYGTLLEKWGCDSIHTTQFAYLDELREAREKVRKEILIVEKEFYILSELAGYVKTASCPSKFYQDNSYENLRDRRLFESSKSQFGLYVEDYENRFMRAKRYFFTGEYEYALNATKGCHTLYDYYLSEARRVLNSSFTEIMSSLDSRWVHLGATERTGGDVNEIVTKGNNLSSSSTGIYNSGSYDGNYSGGYSGSGSSSQNTGTATIPRTKCPNCTNGRSVYESTVPYSGTEIRYSTCSECGLRYQSSYRTHRHDRCTTCHGTGFLD